MPLLPSDSRRGRRSYHRESRLKPLLMALVDDLLNGIEIKNPV
jgi:hypothetical protein